MSIYYCDSEKKSTQISIFDIDHFISSNLKVHWCPIISHHLGYKCQWWLHTPWRYRKVCSYCRRFLQKQQTLPSLDYIFYGDIPTFMFTVCIGHIWDDVKFGEFEQNVNLALKRAKIDITWFKGIEYQGIWNVHYALFIADHLKIHLVEHIFTSRAHSKFLASREEGGVDLVCSDCPQEILSYVSKYDWADKERFEPSKALIHSPRRWRRHHSEFFARNPQFIRAKQKNRIKN